eukprot:4481240-Pyramimonas_sp.AAC.1
MDGRGSVQKEGAGIWVSAPVARSEVQCARPTNLSVIFRPRVGPRPCRDVPCCACCVNRTPRHGANIWLSVLL